MVSSEKGINPVVMIIINHLEELGQIGDRTSDPSSQDLYTTDYARGHRDKIEVTESITNQRDEKHKICMKSQENKSIK